MYSILRAVEEFLTQTEALTFYETFFELFISIEILVNSFNSPTKQVYGVVEVVYESWNNVVVDDVAQKKRFSASIEGIYKRNTITQKI